MAECSHCQHNSREHREWFSRPVYLTQIEDGCLDCDKCAPQQTTNEG